MNIHKLSYEKHAEAYLLLSELFLDTELSCERKDEIATGLIQIGYGEKALEKMLWNDVFPVCRNNLMGIGEWQGFDKDWLIDEIYKNQSKKSLFIHSSFGKNHAIEQLWKEIKQRMNNP